MDEPYHGFTLIEVLVSLLILTIVLCGLESLLIFSSIKSIAAYHFSVASQQMVSMVERLKAFRQLDGLDREIIKWNLQNNKNLPQGFGAVDGDYPYYTISIHWGKPPYHCQDDGKANCLSTQVTIL